MASGQLLHAQLCKHDPKTPPIIAPLMHSASIHPYLRAKQHKRPDLPRNQQHPVNRTRARKAVDHSSSWKNRAVLETALDYRDVSSMQSKLSLETYTKTKFVEIFIRDHHSQQRVRKYPERHQACSETSV